VLLPGTTVTSPRGTRVEVLQNTLERFQIKRTLPPRTGKTPAHRHLDGIEKFEVLEGEARGSVHGISRRMRPEDVLYVPEGAAHIHPFTTAEQTATILHTIEPRPRFVEVFFASWLGWLEQGKTDRQDEPTLLQIMAVMKDGGGGTWVAGPPIAVQKALANVLGRVAERRGQGAHAPG